MSRLSAHFLPVMSSAGPDQLFSVATRTQRELSPADKDQRGDQTSDPGPRQRNNHIISLAPFNLTTSVLAAARDKEGLDIKKYFDKISSVSVCVRCPEPRPVSLLSCAGSAGVSVPATRHYTRHCLCLPQRRDTTGGSTGAQGGSGAVLCVQGKVQGAE